MLNSLNEPQRWRNHSRTTKSGQRTWKRKALCSNGVPCRSRIRKRISPASPSSISVLWRAKLTRAPLTTDRSLAIASSSRTKPWSRTRMVFSGITSGVTATAPSVTGLYVGTSGFSFATWKGGFYPPDAKPVGFRFAVKMTMSITHWGRLDEIGTFCERVRSLGDRLGPILVRLPDNRPRDDGFLRLLLGSVDPELRLAFDLRDPSWDGVEPALAEAGAVRVNSLETHGPFRYLRLREPPYDDTGLAAWAGRVKPVVQAGIDVYCYFKHEEEPTGPRYAERLLQLASGEA